MPTPMPEPSRKRYHIRQAQGPDDMRAYIALLRVTYEKLGFLEAGIDRFIAGENAHRFMLFYDGMMIGIFCLQEVAPGHVHYTKHIPAMNRPDVRALEVTNLILRKQNRGSLGLPLLLSHAVHYALDNQYDLLVGIARYSALRAFVDAGAIPIYHPPLHLLGKENISDFISYFDLRTAHEVGYIQQRSQRLLDQIEVLEAIRSDFLQPTANPPSSRAGATGHPGSPSIVKGARSAKNWKTLA